MSVKKKNKFNTIFSLIAKSFKLWCIDHFVVLKLLFYVEKKNKL